jgi:hypothetical protein
MLKENLLRDGIDLSVETDILYIDVTNGRIGIGTSIPSVEMEVVGGLIAGDMQIDGNTLSVGNPAGLIISTAGSSDISVSLSKIINCEDPVNPLDVVNLRTLQDELGAFSGNKIEQLDSNVTVTDDGGYVAEITFDINNVTIATFDENFASFQIPITTNGQTITTGNAQLSDIDISGSAITTTIGNDLTLQSNTDIINVDSAIRLRDTSTFELVFTNATNDLISSGTLAFDGSTLDLTGDQDITGTLTVTGSAVVDDITIDGNDITSSNDLSLTTTANGDLTATLGSGIARIESTSAFKIPVGVQGERPLIPEAGMIRFNTLTDEAEIYDGTSWSGFTSEFVSFALETLDGDGSTVTFTLTNTPAAASSMLVDINGVAQEPLVAYTWNSTLNQITFTDVPQIGDHIVIRHLANVTDVKAVADEVGTTMFIAESAQAKVIVANVDQLVFDGTKAEITTTLQPAIDLGQNLGASGKRFNNLHVNLINGAPADVAENFVSDSQYEPGTVVVLGGEAEVTQSTRVSDTAVAGIVSTEPAYLLNAYAQDAVPVGLVGRVPCKVVGPIKRGDLLITSSTPGHACAIGNRAYVPGSVVGKAMQDFHSDVGVILVLLALS